MNKIKPFCSYFNSRLIYAPELEEQNLCKPLKSPHPDRSVPEFMTISNIGKLFLYMCSRLNEYQAVENRIDDFEELITQFHDVLLKINEYQDMLTQENAAKNHNNTYKSLFESHAETKENIERVVRTKVKRFCRYFGSGLIFAQGLDEFCKTNDDHLSNRIMLDSTTVTNLGELFLYMCLRLNDYRTTKNTK
jgi:hypothetical protein